jgi:hypothetical protein
MKNEKCTTAIVVVFLATFALAFAQFGCKQYENTSGEAPKPGSVAAAILAKQNVCRSVSKLSKYYAQYVRELNLTLLGTYTWSRFCKGFRSERAEVEIVIAELEENVHGLNVRVGGAPCDESDLDNQACSVPKNRPVFQPGYTEGKALVREASGVLNSVEKLCTEALDTNSNGERPALRADAEDLRAQIENLNLRPEALGKTLGCP